MEVSADLLELAVRKLTAGASVSATARALGISRAKFYRLAERHQQLKALLPGTGARSAPTHRAAPAQREPQQPQPAGLTPYDIEGGLDSAQVQLFCREMYRSGSIPAAAAAAGVDMQPHRLDPKTIPRQARDHLREALRLVAESRRAPGPTAEQQALTAWLAGAEWPHDADLDLDALRQLSARAATDWERTKRARALVTARHACRAKRDAADAGWEAF